MFYKMLLAFESVDETLKYEDSDESCLGGLFCDAVHYAI